MYQTLFIANYGDKGSTIFKNPNKFWKCGRETVEL